MDQNLKDSLLLITVKEVEKHLLTAIPGLAGSLFSPIIGPLVTYILTIAFNQDTKLSKELEKIDLDVREDLIGFQDEQIKLVRNKDEFEKSFINLVNINSK